MFKKIASLVFVTTLLTGCAAGAGLTPRGHEHQAAIQDVVIQSKDFGFGNGQISKDCAVAFDCSANDLFHYTAQLSDKDFNSDEALCQNLFALGEKLGFKDWRRDFHDPEETFDQSNFADGVKACVESLAVNSGEGNASQSEGVIIYGSIAEDSAPVMVNLQVNSLNKPEFAPDSDRGYYFLVQTTEG
jgi:hypothetical protein